MGAANHIENRWSQRRKVSLAVDVIDADAHLEHCRTRDVGLGGVFVEISAERQPAENAEVELLFKLIGKDQRLVQHRLRAKVVRATAEGIGLMFRGFDTSSFRSLQELMRQATPEDAPKLH